ncbi:morphogenetic protein [Pantoea sp. CCBC3-3-1]|uniref:morphogenetic protein n=1 Tax=Pantoea sp. CCBC3-3-1 TaxID=2490851 RepID=UPI0011BEF13B|nr:morphogenetic protein [Pantoea sp. CCBC3-3-1]
MLIPFFPLPSRPETTVQFNAPSVDMAMYFCKSQESTEERDTTEYLNMLQVKESFSDARDWTANDRRTALWWVFINSRADSVIDFSYTCQHCGEEHWINQDMHELVGDLEVLAGAADMTIEATVQGKVNTWLLKPLDGHAMERLERMRQLLPSTSRKQEYLTALTELRLWEFVYQAHLFYDLEPDYDKSAQYRYELIKQMDVGTEFAHLAASVRMMQQNLRHGLNVILDKGESCLLLPPHECPSEALKEPAERPTTRLLVPFRNSQFLPDIGTGSLANLSQQLGLVWPSTT